MQSIKQGIYGAVSVAMFCVLAACGVPASGSSVTDSPTVTSGEATSAAPVPGATAGGQPTNELDGTSWQLTEFGPGGTVQAAKGTVTLVFGPGDSIGGNSGCNSYGGTYTSNGTSISVRDVASTEMACADNDLMQQESTYGAALSNATAVAINGDELRISYPEGTLLFTRMKTPTAAPVEGTVWQLDSIVTGKDNNASASPLINGSSITAEWDNGTVRGTAGCNQFSAAYTLEGETLVVGEVIATRMACEASIMQQEQVFVDALGAASSLRIDGTNLVLTHPNGKLIFRASTQ